MRLQNAKQKREPSAPRWLLTQARPARRWIALSIVAGLCGGGLLILQAWLLAQIVHGAFIDRRPVDSLIPFFVGLIAVAAARALAVWSRENAGFMAGAAVRRRVRSALLEHLFGLPPPAIARMRTGALAGTVLEQVEALQAFFADYLPQLVLAAAIPAAILAVVFPISWAAGAILLITAPLIPIFMILVGMGADTISQKHYSALARLGAHFLDVLQGIATLKLFDRSRSQAVEVGRRSADYRRRTMAVLRVAFLSAAVLEFFSAVAIALVAVYLGMRYLGYFEFGTYGRPLSFLHGFLILLLAPDFYAPLRELGTHYHARADAAGAAAEILKILKLPGPSGETPPVRTAPAGRIRIRFERVAKSYEDGGRIALESVDLSVEAGENVAVVGPSGAGKSTLVHLLAGFIQPDRGRIRINGLPLDTLDRTDWRSRIAWVGQQPILFHGTLFENIRLANPAADTASVRRAAREAGVLDFAAELPRGLETAVGEQGLGLSRGQIQRVALARAFLKDAPLLLLDEPTAGLDRAAESRILAGLQRLAAGRTTLLVTHRLRAARMAQRIAVVERGCIVEQGAWPELMSARGALWRLAGGSDTRGENR